MLLTAISTRHSNFLEAGILFGQLTRFVLFRFVLFVCFVCHVVRFSLSNLLGFQFFKGLAPIPYSEILLLRENRSNIPDVKIQISRKTSRQELGM